MEIYILYQIVFKIRVKPPAASTLIRGDSAILTTWLSLEEPVAQAAVVLAFRFLFPSPALPS